MNVLGSRGQNFVVLGDMILAIESDRAPATPSHFLEPVRQG
jgi:hypothetical protein